MTKPSVKVRASVILTAKAPGFILKRTGYKCYEGAFNGKKVRIRCEDVVAKGSFPANRRQKRESRWYVQVDDQPAGEARSYREARAMAYDACVTLPDGSQSGCDAGTKTAGKPVKCPHCNKHVDTKEWFGAEGRWLHRPCVSKGPVANDGTKLSKSAGNLRALDTLGREHWVKLQDVKPLLDRVRLLEGLILDDGLEVMAEEEAEVQHVDPHGPTLEIWVSSSTSEGDSTTVKRRSVPVPAEKAILLLSADDLRIA